MFVCPSVHNTQVKNALMSPLPSAPWALPIRTRLVLAVYSASFFMCANTHLKEAVPVGLSVCWSVGSAFARRSTRRKCWPTWPCFLSPILMLCVDDHFPICLHCSTDSNLPLFGFHSFDTIIVYDSWIHHCSMLFFISISILDFLYVLYVLQYADLHKPLVHQCGSLLLSVQ